MKHASAGMVLAVAMMITVVPAESAPSPGTVVANVQKFYASANQLTAKFRQVVTNAAFNTTQTSDGRVWVVKPASFRFDYAAKSGGGVAKSFIFDGMTLWHIDHRNQQVIQSPVQGSVLPAAVAFLTGGSLAAEFNVALAAPGKTVAGNAVTLELTPKQPTAQYQRVFLVVDPVDWHVRESVVVQASGDTNTFKFFAPDLTKPVRASWFQVAPSALPSYRRVVLQPGSPPGSPSSAPASGSSGSAASGTPTVP